MTTLITVLIVLAAIILILVVLVQKSKGGGLSSSFASSNAVMGVRKTTDFIEKATWGLAGFIIVMSILCVMLMPKKGTVPQSVIMPQNQAPVNSSTLPDFSTTLPTGGTSTPADNSSVPSENTDNQ